MPDILWLLLLLFSSGIWYSVGIRVQRGRQEQERIEIENRAMERSRRSGNVVLNSVKIRR